MRISNPAFYLTSRHGVSQRCLHWCFYRNSLIRCYSIGKEKEKEYILLKITEVKKFKYMLHLCYTSQFYF